ncbi:cobalt-precorrin-4 C(11)-methyltransferase [Klebsiella pneumoniae subsp. pneumoniae]|uniref:Cobalt-precorrin-4 C(11)-methyltransferase n=1 Tax=Klebsiella pneumoniae subsp. pneumoniae TaxID=72407 RepID=A0A377Z554_KLEPN|nr:cobalt-precorrin-4 C(11)-methyltransferase [Klebsiella pneumoniae subsp. pneumoniae]
MIYAGVADQHRATGLLSATGECHDSAALHLEQILDLMEAGVKAGKTVVRLQTGDVSLYGSVREQGEELTRRGIRWQVVPGVSAFLGAAAELGVEYTVPEVSQSLIITRLEGRTPVPRARTAGSLCQPSNPRWRFTCRCNVFTGWRSGWWRAATPRPPRSR